MDTTGRTLVCSVLFLDIVEYTRKPVSEQLLLKQAFNQELGRALEGVPSRDRIILDTGDGAAVTFMGDPEDALFAAMTMRDMKVPVRLGVNLGPVRLVKDLNGQVNIIGDGINVAQRVMSFSTPGQLLVSRSFYEVVSCLSRDYANLFHHEGSRTDKHVREHDVYSVIGGTPARLSDTLSDSGTTGVPVTWLGRPGPLGLRRSAILAAPLAFMLIVAGGVGAGALIEPRQPAIDQPAPSAAAVVAPLPAKSVITPVSPALKPAARVQTKLEPPAAAVQPATPAVQQMTKVEAATPAVQQMTKVEAATPAGAPRAGKIQISVAPWGEIFIDGKKRGVSPPLRELVISAGAHTIEIRNATFSPHLQRVDVIAGQTTKVTHKFR
jgi:class 3 adenylate cyclase